MQYMQCNVTPGDKSVVNPNLRKEGHQTRLTCLPSGQLGLLVQKEKDRYLKAAKKKMPLVSGNDARGQQKCPKYQKLDVVMGVS